jgi:hypothetical protein
MTHDELCQRVETLEKEVKGMGCGLAIVWFFCLPMAVSVLIGLIFGVK